MAIYNNIIVLCWFLFFSIFVVCLFCFSLHCIEFLLFLFIWQAPSDFSIQQMKNQIFRWKFIWVVENTAIAVTALWSMNWHSFFFFYTNLRRWNNKISMNSNLHSLVFFIHTYFFFQVENLFRHRAVGHISKLLVFQATLSWCWLFLFSCFEFCFFSFFFLFWFWPRCHSRIH